LLTFKGNTRIIVPFLLFLAFSSLFVAAFFTRPREASVEVLIYSKDVPAIPEEGSLRVYPLKTVIRDPADPAFKDALVVEETRNGTVRIRLPEGAYNVTFWKHPQQKEDGELDRLVASEVLTAEDTGILYSLVLRTEKTYGFVLKLWLFDSTYSDVPLDASAVRVELRGARRELPFIIRGEKPYVNGGHWRGFKDHDTGRRLLTYGGFFIADGLARGEYLVQVWSGCRLIGRLWVFMDEDRELRGSVGYERQERANAAYWRWKEHQDWLLSCDAQGGSSVLSEGQQDGNHTLGVNLVDPENNPVPDHVVEVQDLNGDVLREGITEMDGEDNAYVEFSGLATDWYRVYAPGEPEATYIYLDRDMEVTVDPCVGHTLFVDDLLDDRPSASFQTIQDAVDASNPYDSILVLPGIYMENVVVDREGLTICSTGGPQATIVDASGAPDQPCFLIVADGVTIGRSGFTIVNACIGICVKPLLEGDSISGVRIQGNIIRSNEFAGIYLDHSSRGRIMGNEVYDNNGFEGAQGICLEYSDRNTISRNDVYGNGWGGIRLLESHGNTISKNEIYEHVVFGIDVEGSGGNILSGFRIYGSYDGAISENANSDNNDAGMVFSRVLGNVIFDNKIHGNGEYGIILGFSAGNVISRNRVAENGLGIFLGFSSGNAISGNIIVNNGVGIYLDSSSGNVISRNRIAANSDLGIFLTSSSENAISRNMILDNGIGIYLDSSSSNVISRNDVAGNDLGIFLDSSSNNISGNIITDNIYSIYLSSSSGNTISRNMILGNDYGIFLDYSSGNTISGNVIKANLDGIRLLYSSHNVISKNMIYRNLGILLEYSDFNTISRNKIDRNRCGIQQYYSYFNIISGNRFHGGWKPLHRHTTLRS